MGVVRWAFTQRRVIAAEPDQRLRAQMRFDLVRESPHRQGSRAVGRGRTERSALRAAVPGIVSAALAASWE